VKHVLRQKEPPRFHSCRSASAASSCSVLEDLRLHGNVKDAADVALAVFERALLRRSGAGAREKCAHRRKKCARRTK